MYIPSGFRFHGVWFWNAVSVRKVKHISCRQFLMLPKLSGEEAA